MSFVQLQMPLADVLIETGAGIAAINRAFSDTALPNSVTKGEDVGIRATSASVKLKFAASLVDGYEYTKHTYSAGGVFTFWILGGAGAGWYSSTELRLYREYTESIGIEVEVKFEATPAINRTSSTNPA